MQPTIPKKNCNYPENVLLVLTSYGFRQSKKIFEVMLIMAFYTTGIKIFVKCSISTDTPLLQSFHWTEMWLRCDTTGVCH